MKMKNFCQLFAAMFIFGFLAAIPSVSNAQTATTTFPVNEAGIAAYVKLDSISQTNFDNARQSLFDSVESFEDNYMIGTKEYSFDGIDYHKINFHIYLNTGGWLVVYLLKNEEPGRIANWRTDAATGKLAPLGNTLLKIAIEDAISKIGALVAEPLKYYDFAYPDAKKMTLVREIIDKSDEGYSDDFSMLIPGPLHQASYALKCFNCAINSWTAAAMLYIDNAYVGGDVSNDFFYGNYDNAMLGVNESHMVRLDRRYGSSDYVGAATLLLYSPD